MSANTEHDVIIPSSSPTHFTSLPLDTVQYYLLPFLQDRDIAFLAVTCKWFHQTLVQQYGIEGKDELDDDHHYQEECFADCLWKRLVTKRWKSLNFPQQLKKRRTDLGISHCSSSGWYLEYCSRAKRDCRTHAMVKELLRSVKNKSRENIKKTWCDLLSQGYDGYDVLRSLSGEIQNRERTYDFPTIESIAEEAFVGIHRLSICKKFQRFAACLGGHARNSEGDPPFLSLEEGAILIAKFYQKADNLKAEYDNGFTLAQFVDQELTLLAETLILRLKKNDGTGSYSIRDVLNEMQNFFSEPTNESVTSSEDEFIETRTFQGNQQDYYNFQNSLLDEVIRSRRGIPISLSVIYAGIVQRVLGLQLEPVGLPGHFLLSTTLSCKDKPMERIFIDSYNGGKILNQMDCVRIVSQYGIPWNVSFLISFINSFNL